MRWAGPEPGEHTDDVLGQVLSRAGRMHLMPFAALTNGLGGTVVLFVTSLIAPALS